MASYFLLASHPSSTFDVVLSNLIEPHSVSHSFEILSEIIRIMKPNSILCAKETSEPKLAANLKLTGFSNIKAEDSSASTFTAQKPNFEVGSSSKLSFGKPAVWSLSDGLVDDQIEFINEDDLLDETDLLKPAAETLKGKHLLGFKIERIVKYPF